MAVSFDKLRGAFETHLAALDLENVAWENIEFKPPVDAQFYRTALMPVEPSAATIGRNGVDKVTGIFQVIVYGPKDTGTAGLFQSADEIIAHFSRGLDLPCGETTVTVRRAWQGPAFNSGANYAVPVSVTFYIYG